MKKLSIPCDFRGESVPFPIYIGNPRDDKHPLQHQSSWLSEDRGGMIPQTVMDSFETLHSIAKEEGYLYEDLVLYALGPAQEEDQPAFDPKQFQEKVISLAAAKSALPKPQPVSSDYKRNLTKIDHPHRNLAVGKTDLERYRHLQRLSQMLMLELNATTSRAATAFFAALCFLFHKSEDGHVDLPGAYDLFAHQDQRYSLAVGLDTYGKFLPRFVYDLIYTVIYDAQHLIAVSAEIRERLIAFCLAERLSEQSLQLTSLHQELCWHLDIAVPGER